MRSSNKSRSRGKNQNRRPSGNIVNRVFDSSGPEGKVRGTPQQIIDKYQALARDAQLGGDRIAAENFLQHAEHYARMLGEAMREQERRREQQEAQQAQRREQQEAQRRERAGEHPETSRDQAEQPQPDVLDVASDGTEDSGLVETPESAPKQRRSRKPRSPDPEPGQAAE